MKMTTSVSTSDPKTQANKLIRESKVICPKCKARISSGRLQFNNVSGKYLHPKRQTCFPLKYQILLPSPVDNKTKHKNK